MIHPEEYKDFYDKLFTPIEAEYGVLDADTIVAIIGFDVGGPLNLCSIENQNLYISCELCCRDDQKPASFGNYELMVVGANIEQWARSIMSDIGRMSLETAFDHHHTLDISPWLETDTSIEGVIFEKHSSIEYKGKTFGVMRVIGITRPELQVCFKKGVDSCLRNLKKAGVYPFTILDRKST
jgi:hypothetical protein